MKRAHVAICVAFVLLTLAACSTARRSEPIIGRELPLKAQFAEGRKIFMQRCHACHPGGEAGLAPAINNKPLPAGLIKFQIRHGLGAMPALDAERISDRELDAVAAYLVALRKVPVRPP